jgi:hypothetical protein
MPYQNRNCVDACLECVAVASYCAGQCIEKEMKDCAQHCLECVEICKTLAVLAARPSFNVDAVAQACAKICDDCAEECEKHDHEHCQDCARACKKCAEECRSLEQDANKKAA